MPKTKSPTTPIDLNDDTAKLLLVCARAQVDRQVLFNEAAHRVQAYAELHRAVLEYLSEVDNPMPDY